MVKKVITNIDIKNIQDQIKHLSIRVENLEKNNDIKNKKRELKKKRDPNKPNRVLSNYIFFYKDFRKEYLEKNPNINSKIIAIAAGEEWTKIKENPKKIKKYNDMVTKDKQRYENELKEYNKNKK
jgi:hypothetical protein